MIRTLLALVALCVVASADSVTKSEWAAPYPVIAAQTTPGDCFASTEIQVAALQYATAANTIVNSDTTTAGKAERSCAAMAASGATLPDWFTAIYSDRVWAVDRSGNGHCLNVGAMGKGLSGGGSITAQKGTSFRPAGSDQTYQYLLTGELFGCQFDSNPNNTAVDDDKLSWAKPITAWRAERFDIYHSNGYNAQGFTSTTGAVAVGFFNTLGTELTWDNPTNAGMNTQWDAPFAATCATTASTLICNPGIANCAANQQRAQIACASSSVLFAYSGMSSYPCGVTDRNGLVSNAAICTGKTNPQFGLGVQLFGEAGLFTWTTSKLNPMITSFQNQTTTGWGLDSSRKFYVADNQQITVGLSGTADTAILGRQTTAGTFNNKVFIDKTIDVSTGGGAAVKLNQINYNSNTNQATFRASDGKCQGSNTGASVCGDPNNGFNIGQQYWAKVQSTYQWIFTPTCVSITGVASYPYIFNCDSSYVAATTNGATFNNADNSYPTSQRQFSANAATEGKQNILQSGLLGEITLSSDPVYLGFVSYGANEEFDVARNWVAETRDFGKILVQNRSNVSTGKPIYVTELLDSEKQYEDHVSAQLIATQTNDNAKVANNNANNNAKIANDNANNNAKIANDNAKIANNNAKDASDGYNYAMGLIGAGIVVFAVFFLVAVCVFSAAYVKSNQGKKRDLTAGDLTFTKTEMSRT